MTDEAVLKFATAVQRHLFATRPGMTDEAVAKVVELVTRDQIARDSIVYRIGDVHYTSASEIERHLTRVNPDPALMREYPTTRDAHAALIAAHREAHGQDPAPDVRLRLYREAEAMDAETRAKIAKVGQGGDLRKEPPPVSPHVFDDGLGEFDARIEALTGEDPRSMLPSRRRMFHDALKSKTNPIDEATRAGYEGKDEDKLSPSERLTRHRMQNKGP